MLLVMFVLNLYITPQHFIDVSTFNLRFNNHRKEKKAKKYNFSLQTLINIISNHNFQRKAYKKSNENFCKRMVSIKNLRMSKKWNSVTVIFRLQYCISSCFIVSLNPIDTKPAQVAIMVINDIKCDMRKQNSENFSIW